MSRFVSFPTRIDVISEPWYRSYREFENEISKNFVYIQFPKINMIPLVINTIEMGSL